MLAEFSYDGMFVASTSLDGTIRIWDAMTGNCLNIINNNIIQANAAFSPNNSLIVCTDNFNLKVYKTWTGECIKELIGHEKFITRVAFNNDGSLILSSSWDARIKIWDAMTGNCLSKMDIKLNCCKKS